MPPPVLLTRSSCASPARRVRAGLALAEVLLRAADEVVGARLDRAAERADLALRDGVEQPDVGAALEAPGELGGAEDGTGIFKYDVNCNVVNCGARPMRRE